MDGLKFVHSRRTPRVLWYQPVRGVSNEASAKASSQLCNNTLSEEVNDIHRCARIMMSKQSTAVAKALLTSVM